MATNIKLVVELQGQVLQRLPLLGACFSLGRAPNNAVVLPLPAVSKRHAELRLEEGVVFVTDLGSQHGTFVAGARLQAHQPYPLLAGLAVQIGPYLLTVQSEASETEETPEALPVSIDPMFFDVALETESNDAARPSLPLPLPDVGQRAKYLQFLPAIFQEQDFTNRFLQIFETLWEPVEWRQRHIEMYFDPRTCPTSMLQRLCAWVGLRPDPRWSEAALRRVLGEVSSLQHYWGTSYALVRMIELVTGVTPQISNHPDVGHVIAVDLPPGTSARHIDLIRGIIETHKPAHVAYRLGMQEAA